MHFRCLLLLLLFVPTTTAVSQSSDLPSWNEGPTKQQIVDFVAKVTKEGTPDFVPPAERIATFDNDGTLWCEHPMYVELAFTLDRVKVLAEKHPEWKERQPYKGVLEGNLKEAAAAGEQGIVEMFAITHADMTPAAFDKMVIEWLSTAKHPRFKRPYTELIYQPMVELLAYLRAKGFKTYIVSGGTQEFMRPWAEKAYGIPREQIVGSSIKTKYELRSEQPILMRLPEVDFVDDKVGKPVGIQKHIGRRPIAAFGNSDGDYEMLRWTTAGEGARLGLIVHHTDAEREYAYDRDTHFGRLDKALTEAPQWKWAVADMKRDWKVIFPPEK